MLNFLKDKVGDAFPLPGWVLIVIIALIVVAIVALVVIYAKKGNNVQKETKTETKVKEETKPVIKTKKEETKDTVKPVVKKEEPKPEDKPVAKKEEPKPEDKPVVKKEEPKKETAPEPVKEVKKDDSTDKSKSPKQKGIAVVTKTENKKPVKAKPVKAKPNQEEEKIDTFGKFVLIKDDKVDINPFRFALRANNGQVLFESEGYKIKPRKTSIDAFKRHVKSGTFSVDEDKQGTFRYKLYKQDGVLLGVGESYKSREACENSIESVKRFSETATLIEDLTK